MILMIPKLFELSLQKVRIYYLRVRTPTATILLWVNDFSDLLKDFRQLYLDNIE